MDASQLDLDELSNRCHLESLRYFQGKTHEPGYCFELFRRAFVARNPVAWEYIYIVYQSLVSGWIKNHPSFPRTGEEVQYFVNRAYEKMWSSITAEKFGHFPNLSSLLRYLKMCSVSAVIDYQRVKARLQLVDLVEPISSQAQPAEFSLEDHTIDKMKSEALWQQINAMLNNDKEHTVMYGCFVLGLKPREIQVQFPGVFRDIKHIYRVKENVLARLRRNQDLLEYLSEYAVENP